MPQRFPGFSCNSNGCRRDISVDNGSTCDELGPPPAIATCIAGAARTFGTPVVQSHLRRNLVEALGGSAGSRLFLLLKTLDSNKFVKRSEPGAVVFKQHLGEASVGGLLATYATQTSIRRLADPRQLCYSHVLSRALDRLRLPWLAHRVGEAVVLNGSGSYSAGDPVVGDCAAPPYCVAQASPDAWRAFRMAACVCHTGLELRTSKPHTVGYSHTCAPRLGQNAPDVEAAPGYKGSCCSGRRSADEERLLLQALSVRWCAGAVERYEAQQATRFSLVVFTRPDLVWWQPFKPWCSWPQGAVLTCESPGCDVAWAAPRAHLARMGRQQIDR